MRILDSVSSQLKSARVSNGLSQNEVATILHISRQSVSKWENGRTYPDIDNLVLLSELYKTSIDDLVKSNEELQQQIKANNSKIKERQTNLKKINTETYQNRDEGIFLAVLGLVSAIIPPIGIFIPIYVMWRNNRFNSLYKSIYVICIVVMIVSLWGTLIFLNDNWFDPTQTKIYKVN